MHAGKSISYQNETSKKSYQCSQANYLTISVYRWGKGSILQYRTILWEFNDTNHDEAVTEEECQVQMYRSSLLLQQYRSFR